MFSYSHRPDHGWLGSFPNPVAALIAARSKLGKVRVFIGKWEPAYFSDFMLGADEVLSYMKERVSDRLGDQYADDFDALGEYGRALNVYLRNAVEEWESDLPDELRFSGQHVKTIVGYEPNEEVRKADFS